MKKTMVIILAGGTGGRFESKLPKQFCKINNIPLFIYALNTFNKYNTILTIPKRYRDLATENIRKYKLNKIYVIDGGMTRQESVFKALQYIDRFFVCDNVIITDANRPCIKKETVDKCLQCLKKHISAVAVTKTINTCCISNDEKSLLNVINRKKTYELLMPQCFNFKFILAAHKILKDSIKDVTDDTQIALCFNPNIKIKLVKMSFWEGLKLTYPEDKKIFEVLLKER